MITGILKENAWILLSYYWFDLNNPEFKQPATIKPVAGYQY